MSLVAKCTPCQAKRIQAIIKKVRYLKAAEEYLKHSTYQTHTKEEVYHKPIEFYRKKDGKLYIKTFLIDDTRNNNGWRASWNSIKKRIRTFIGRPGIEYMKCDQYGCMLDHTIAPTFEENLHVQEPHRVTTIVDTALDESTHTAYAIHRVENEEFAQKIESGEIKYLSPSIAPVKEKTTISQNPDNDDEWYIDTTDWRGLHAAFVHMPAYNHKARVVGKCTGDEKCVTELKNNSTLVARTQILIQKIRVLNAAGAFTPKPDQAGPDKDGNYWITVNGNPIPIKKGDNVKDTIANNFKDKEDKSQKETTPKTEKPTSVKDLNITTQYHKNLSKYNMYYKGIALDSSKIEQLALELGETDLQQFGIDNAKYTVKDFNIVNEMDDEVRIPYMKADTIQERTKIFMEFIQETDSYDTFRSVEEHLHAFNIALQYQAAKAEKFHRLTGFNELDSYLEKDPIFGESTHGINNGGDYKCASLQPIKDMEFDHEPALVTYPADKVREGSKTALYTQYAPVLPGHLSSDIKPSINSLARAFFMNETEIRIKSDTKIPVGDMEITFRHEMDSKERDRLQEKYGSLGKLSFAKVKDAKLDAADVTRISILIGTVRQLMAKGFVPRPDNGGPDVDGYYWITLKNKVKIKIKPGENVKDVVKKQLADKKPKEESVGMTDKQIEAHHALKKQKEEDINNYTPLTTAQTKKLVTENMQTFTDVPLDADRIAMLVNTSQEAYLHELGAWHKGNDNHPSREDLFENEAAYKVYSDLYMDGQTSKADELFSAAVAKSPRGKEFTKFEESVQAFNIVLKQKAAKAKRFYRMTDEDELDSYLQKNSKFGESTWGIGKEGAGYKCLSVDPVNVTFNKPVQISYPADKIREGSKTVAYSTLPFNKKGRDLYFEESDISEPLTIGFMPETEVRIPESTKIPVGELEIRFIRKFHTAEDKTKLRKKYGSLGKIFFADEDDAWVSQ